MQRIKVEIINEAVRVAIHDCLIPKEHNTSSQTKQEWAEQQRRNWFDPKKEKPWYELCDAGSAKGIVLTDKTKVNVYDDSGTPIDSFEFDAINLGLAYSRVDSSAVLCAYYSYGCRIAAFERRPDSKGTVTLELPSPYSRDQLVFNLHTVCNLFLIDKGIIKAGIPLYIIEGISSTKVPEVNHALSIDVGEAFSQTALMSLFSTNRKAPDTLVWKNLKMFHKYFPFKSTQNEDVPKDPS